MAKQAITNHSTWRKLKGKGFIYKHVDHFYQVRNALSATVTIKRLSLRCCKLYLLCIGSQKLYQRPKYKQTNQTYKEYKQTVKNKERLLFDQQGQDDEQAYKWKD